MQSVLLASIFYIAPNGKFLLLKIFIGVRSLWLLLLLTLLIFPFFYETKIENLTFVYSWDHWSAVIIELIVLLESLEIYSLFKEEAKSRN